MGFYSVEQKGRKLQAKQRSYQVQQPHLHSQGLGVEPELVQVGHEVALM